MAESNEDISEAMVSRFGVPFAKALATFVKELGEPSMRLESGGPTSRAMPIPPSGEASGFRVVEVPVGENPAADERMDRIHSANQKLAREGKLRTVEFDSAKPAKAAGDRLKRLLKERGLKQVEIARRLGVSPSVVNRVLKHPERSRLKTIRNIADAAGIPLKELI